MAAPNLMPEDVELRCRGGLAGIINGRTIEVKCRHWACTAGGNVTFHYFDVITGELVETKQYKDPNKEKR
jgi:hypothetical protein